MTVGDWLSSRTPAPPEPLAERLREALGARLNDSASEAERAVLETAESMLSQLVALDCAMRDRAIDLLAVDALVTYAFEAAAERPDTLAQGASAAMAALAKLATPTSCA